MGLISTAIHATSSTLKDQWKEFFYCDAMGTNILMARGKRHADGKSNNRGNDNVISNGSTLAVADKQCAIIVDQGLVTELCAAPGEYKYDTSSEPSIFEGGLGQGIINTFKTIGKRISYGGDSGKEQRIYYINLLPITNNTFGSTSPIPFRIVDERLNFDYECSLRCNGMYTYEICDPILFYTNVCANIGGDTYNKNDTLDQQLRVEFVSALQPALAKIAEMGIRYSQIGAHIPEICDALNEVLSKKWQNSRGIRVTDVSFNVLRASDKDEQVLKDLQITATNINPAMAAANMVQAQTEAMRNMKGGGSFGAVMGVNLAQSMNSGTSPMEQLMMLNQQKMQQQQQQQTAPAANSWTCSCGTVNQGKFCTECAKPKPAPAAGWTCECGTVNQGKFCQECGKQKPADAPLYRCDKCGWTPSDPAHPPKFCPECGDVFDEKDAK